jgi:hypothetical protein
MVSPAMTPQSKRSVGQRRAAKKPQKAAKKATTPDQRGPSLGQKVRGTSLVRKIRQTDMAESMRARKSAKKVRRRIEARRKAGH